MPSHLHLIQHLRFLSVCTLVYLCTLAPLGLWSAKNSTGPWHRVATLRNTASMYTVCKDEAGKGKKNTCSWATTLIFAQSGVNGSTPVWNLFYSAGEAGRFQPGDGIAHAVSTTDNIAGPYVDLPGTFVPGTGVVVPDTHAFAAWKLRNGSWVGFRNNVPGMHTFSVGLIASTGDGGRTVGGTWRYSDNNSVPFRFGPENPQVSASTDGRWYYSVYDALEQPPQGGVENGHSNHQSNHPLCTSKTQCDSIGIAWSMDGVTWAANASDTLRVQLNDNHPCGQIRTALGLVGEPHLCRGCYSVLWTGFSNQSNSMRHGPGFEPVCQAIIRNVNE